MLRSFYYPTLVLSLNLFFTIAIQDNSTDDTLPTAKDSFGVIETLNSSNVDKVFNKTIFNESTAMGSNFSSIVKGTAEYLSNASSSKGPKGRSLKDLSAGEEYLLSVASAEDLEGGSWENLPFLKSLIKKGILDLDEKPTDDRMKEILGQPSMPSNMIEMMSMMASMKKADKDDDEKPTGFLAKLAMDPMNILLAAIIPFSLLLAAVIPILTNQLMTGMYIPSVATTATGERERSMKDSNSTEFFVPILESIASFSAKAFEEVTHEKPYDGLTRWSHAD